MKIVYLILILSLVSCSKLTDEEKELVGKWSWDIESGAYGEKGYLNLSKSGKYSYFHESTNPTEVLSENFDQEVHSWYLQDKKICLSRGRGEKSDCGRFSVIESGEIGKIQFNYGFIKEGVHASRQKSPNK